MRTSSGEGRPRGEVVHPTGHGRELLGDAVGGGPADAGAGRDAALDRQDTADLGGQVLRHRAVLGVGRLVELDAAFLAVSDERTRDLVRVAEGHALADEPLGDVGGEREALRRELGHPVGVEGQRRDHAGERGQQDLELRDRVEDGLLVLLEVAVVREREPLQRREEPGEVPDETPGLAPGELGDVGVLLLRHDARPGRERVVEADEAELLRVPEDDLLGQAGHVDADLGQHERELGHDVTGCGGVDRVVRRPGEAEFVGDRRRVEPERAAREGTGAVRADARAVGPVAEPLEVADQGPRVREQVVREEHGLSVLQVRPARHDRRRVLARLLGDRVDEVDDEPSDAATVVEHVHAAERRDLVVAAPSRPELAAELGAEVRDEQALEGAVDVLVAVVGEQRTVGVGGLEPVEAAEHAVELVRGQVPGRVQRPGVRTRPGDVVRGELPVEVRRPGQRGQLGAGAVGEAPTPEGAGVRGVGLGGLVRVGHVVLPGGGVGVGRFGCVGAEVSSGGCCWRRSSRCPVSSRGRVGRRSGRVGPTPRRGSRARPTERRRVRSRRGSGPTGAPPRSRSRRGAGAGRRRRRAPGSARRRRRARDGDRSPTARRARGRPTPGRRTACSGARPARG
ncbi:Uncharacterized protein Cus16_0832 [Curtobacterium sp. ER1/6]|nr:Uncharacterized protein Cus16_0832 [Curtobacterium sp. ER1/6]